MIEIIVALIFGTAIVHAVWRLIDPKVTLNDTSFTAFLIILVAYAVWAIATGN